MAFCHNCGKELVTGAKFCAECGTPAGEAGNVRKENYVGEIIKCPSCGATLSSTDLICPECGLELSNRNVSNVSKEFQAGLIKYEGKEERDFIASFPIPNTREELGNFMLLVASILKQDFQGGADQLRVRSFLGKFEEIRSKIFMMLRPDDPLVVETQKWDKTINELYEEYKKILEERAIINKKKLKEQEKIEKKRKRARESIFYNPVTGKNSARFFITLVFFSAIICFLYLGVPQIKLNNETKRLENLHEEVINLIENKEYESAEVALKKMVWSSAKFKSNTYKHKILWAEKRTELQNLLEERQDKK